MSSGNMLKEANPEQEDTKESAPAESQHFSLPQDEQRPQEEDRDEDQEE